MKKSIILFSTLLLVVSINTYGQTAERKNNFTLGGGKGAYRGDLGNAWFKLDEEWYGFAYMGYSRYLNHSFDMSATLTTGDYGHCREDDESAIRPDGTEVLNMLGRLTSLVVSGKYKFANGYLLKEKAKLAPYVYLGLGLNNMTEFFWKNKTRANEGNYTSLNGGIGARYHFNDKFNVTYNLGIGRFNNDNIDFRKSGSNDMFLQSTLAFGMNF